MTTEMLYFVSADGTTMLLSDEDNGGQVFQKGILSFRGFDPYFYAKNEITIDLSLNNNPISFFPFFPLRLGPSEVFGSTLATNSGEIDAWPVWTVVGPGTNPRLT